MSQKTTKVTVTKSTVRVVNAVDDSKLTRSKKVDGRYVTPWDTKGKEPPSSWSNMKYFFTVDESGVPSEEKLNEEPLMQLCKADQNRILNPPESGIRVTWLGHSTALFQLDNVNILTNPNFNERGIKYYHPGDNKRYRSPVYKIDQLPRIDAVLISNSHFDHLDLGSIRRLNDKFKDTILWYAPIGLKDWLDKAGCTHVVEMDWWKEDEVDFIDHSKVEEEEDTCVTPVKFVCTPSQSYHSRTTDDDNAVLWCSWVMMTPRYKVFFVGATGYCHVFQEIGQKYGRFHMAALPVGGYDPEWRFGFENVTPEEAVKIHKDLGAMCSLAIHWGTFAVSNENYLEPVHRLKKELEQQGLSEMQFFTLKHGESRLVEIKEADKKENGEEQQEENQEEYGQKQEDLTADILDQLIDNMKGEE